MARARRVPLPGLSFLQRPRPRLVVTGRSSQLRYPVPVRYSIGPFLVWAAALLAVGAAVGYAMHSLHQALA